MELRYLCIRNGEVEVQEDKFSLIEALLIYIRYDTCIYKKANGRGERFHDRELPLSTCSTSLL